MPETYLTLDELTAAWPDFATGRDPAEQQAIVDAANAAVQGYLGREILLRERTESLSGNGRGRLFLGVTPVVSIASVSIWGQTLDNADGAAWSFVPETGALIRAPGYSDIGFAVPFRRGVGNVVVTYTGGYDPVPAAVKRAVVLTAKGLDSAFRGGGPYKSEAIGAYSYTLVDGGGAAGLTAGGVPLSAAALLAPYRAVHVGLRA